LKVPGLSRPASITKGLGDGVGDGTSRTDSVDLGSLVEFAVAIVAVAVVVVSRENWKPLHPHVRYDRPSRVEKVIVRRTGSFCL
jgi:hypothetical protein